MAAINAESKYVNDFFRTLYEIRIYLKKLFKVIFEGSHHAH